MPLMTGKSKNAFVHNIKAEVNAGKPQKQAVAIAYSEKAKKMADGGEAEPEDSDHEAIMDQVAKEMMDAIESNDNDKLLEAFQCIVADVMQKMSQDGQE